METTYQSYSDVVDTLQGDKTKGMEYLLRCAVDYQHRKKEVETLEEKLNQEIQTRESIRITTKLICNHLNIKPPFSVSHHGTLYVVREDFNMTIVKSDFNLDSNELTKTK